MAGSPTRDNTPTLEEAIRSVIERRLVDVHTTLPGKIVSYDKATQKATIQIQLKKRYVDGTLVSIKPLPAVPISWPRANGGKSFLHMNLLPGDDVVLHFCERSLDNWKTQGGMTDPDDTRKFNLSDAFATPGGSAFPDAFVPSSEAVELANDQSALHLFDDGHVQIKGGGGDELVKVLYDLVNLLKTATTETIFGPELLMPPTDPTWDLILARITAFKKD